MSADLRDSLRWTYGTSALNLVLQFGFVAVLTRLVSPVDYGIMAVAVGVVSYLTYFSDLGVGQVAMRNRTLDVGDLWGIALVALAGNLVVVAVVWATAPALTGLIGLPPEGEAVLRVLALLAPLGGLNAAAQAWLNREMDFRRLGLLSVGMKLVGQGMVALPMAWAGFGVWALVAGAMAQPFIGFVVGGWLTPGRLPVWSRWRRVFAAVRLGANFSAIRVLDATRNHLIPLAVAMLAGAAAAGFYDRGALLSLVMAEMLMAGVGRVLMPVYCRLAQHEPERMAEAFLSMTRRVLCLGFPIAAGVGVAASPLVLTLLGNNWNEVVTPLRLLAAMAACRVMAMMMGGVVEAGGSLRGSMAQSFGVLAATVLWLVMMRPTELSQILWVALAAEFLSAILLMVLAAKVVRLSFGHLLRPVFSAVSVALPVGLAMGLAMVSAVSFDAGPVGCLTAAVLCGGVVGWCVLAYHPNVLLRGEMRAMAAGVMGRMTA